MSWHNVEAPDWIFGIQGAQLAFLRLLVSHKTPLASKKVKKNTAISVSIIYDHRETMGVSQEMHTGL